jgi:hypothetical protein
VGREVFSKHGGWRECGVEGGGGETYSGYGLEGD